MDSTFILKCLKLSILNRSQKFDPTEQSSVSSGASIRGEPNPKNSYPLPLLTGGSQYDFQYRRTTFSLSFVLTHEIHEIRCFLELPEYGFPSSCDNGINS